MWPHLAGIHQTEARPALAGPFTGPLKICLMGCHASTHIFQAFHEPANSNSTVHHILPIEITHKSGVLDKKSRQVHWTRSCWADYMRKPGGVSRGNDRADGCSGGLRLPSNRHPAVGTPPLQGRHCAFFLSLDKMRARIPLAVWQDRRVSQQASGSTGFADATRGRKRGSGIDAASVLHRLLFPERVLTGRNGYKLYCQQVRGIHFAQQRREKTASMRWPVRVPGLTLIRKVSSRGSGSAVFQGPSQGRVG
jgi:hypothetical protein